MANSLDELLLGSDDSKRARELEDLKQRQRRQEKIAHAAKLGEYAARAAGQEELAEFLGAGSDVAKKGSRGEDPGLVRRSASNYGGRVAGKLAKGNDAGAGKTTANALGGNLSGGQAAALGGAVSGALQGEGVKGVAESAAGWYALYIAFGFLTIGSFTVLGFIGALIYLDFHFFVSVITKGKGFFVTMTWWQKGVLAVANMIALLIPMLFVFLIYTATCGNSLVNFGIKAANVASFGYIQNFCTAFEGGRSGGGGASRSIPIELDFVLTSAYRPNSFVDGDPKNPSAHGRGEAFDIALRNPTVGFRPNPPDPRIAQIISLAQGLGFNGTAGDVVDEYNNPSAGTAGPHIHIEFNAGFCGGSVATNPPNDLVQIPASIPRSGVSDARVRSCMLRYLLQLFEEVEGVDT